MTTELEFDAGSHSLDAIQRAIYRFSDRLSADLSTADAIHHCTLHLAPATEDPEAVVADFRTEVIDQVLRERIRAETAETRNLILALAYSRTGLSDQPAPDS